MDLVTGQHLGIYMLVSRIGAGGMGEVWKAEDTRLGRTVAIKILPPTLAADEESKARLLREARTAAQLNHPNIAMIHAIDHVDERWFIVMEFVEGRPLKELIRDGKLSEAEVCRIGREIADALVAAHEKSIIHRDIKPDNVIISNERVKVLDFGIAKQIGGASDPGMFVTQTGVVMGTVHYMSPEQARGQELDGRTDIYSLGILLFEAATGNLPFHGESVTEVLVQIIRDEPPRAISMKPSMAPQLSSVIDRCLRKNRDERFATAGDLARALAEAEAFVSTKKATRADAVPATGRVDAVGTATTRAPGAVPSRSWIGWVAAIALLIAVSVVGSVLVMSRQRPQPAAETAPPPISGALDDAASDVVDVAVATPVIIESSPEPKTGVEDGQTGAPQQAVTPPPAAGGQAGRIAPPAREPDAGMTVADPESTGSVPPQAPSGAVPGAHPGQESGSAQSAYDEGLRFLRERDGKRAAERFEAAVRLDPTFGPPHLKLGEILAVRGNGLLAVVEFERALHGTGMSERETSLARLYLARIGGKNLEFERLLREHDRQWPNDPELAAVKREFEQRPRRAVRPPGSRNDRP